MFQGHLGTQIETIGKSLKNYDANATKIKTIVNATIQ